MDDGKEIYLDNSATTPCLPAAARAVKKALMQNYGNPSSLHGRGVEASKLLKNCRQEAADFLAASPQQIFFTSGGTEANNLAIMGTAGRQKHQGKHILTTEIEHPSVYQPIKYLEENKGFEVTRLKPDERGFISAEQVQEGLRSDTILLSAMQVNNETGARQPLAEIGKIISGSELPLFHVDAVQAPGSVGTRPAAWQADLVSYSGHKFQGPKGTGFLYIKDSNLVEPQLRGGGQEKNMRSGTENMPGLAGLKVALKELPDLSPGESSGRLEDLRAYFLEKLKKRLPRAVLNSPREDCAPHLINFSLPGIKGEVIINALSRRNIYISSGSACHSQKGRLSRVLQAMEIEGPRLEGALRVSLSLSTTRKELDEFFAACAEETELLF